MSLCLKKHQCSQTFRSASVSILLHHENLESTS